MQIFSKSSYYNLIYNAIVVNNDTTMDPLSAGRVQIYIPSVQFEYQSIYTNYINNNNKKDSNDFYKFPWATTLVEVNNGDLVYGGFIENKNNQYIILGKDISATNSITDGIGGATNTGLGSGDILNLTMPIIIKHEVGIVTDTWPIDSNRSEFTTITPNDNNHGWSIGLIQWNGVRAYDLCYEIVKIKTDWAKGFTDKQASLYLALQSSLSANSTTSQRYKFQSSFIPSKGSINYQGIYYLLDSKEGRQVQIEQAGKDTLNNINKLMNTFNIEDYAFIIFLADIMNQYGSGVNDSDEYPYLRGCITEAAKYAKSANTINESISQLEAYYNNYWKSKVGNYMADRREDTIAYIKKLANEGKLTIYTLVDLGKNATSKYIPEVGEYIWPTQKTDTITAFYGDSSMPFNYNFKYKYSIYSYGNKPNMGYPDGSWHGGIDIGNSGKEGDPLIAVGDGVVSLTHTYGTGNPKGQGGIETGGNVIAIKMDKNPRHHFVYMHMCKPTTLKVGDRVKAGQVIGYMGTTGNSSGWHLHLGLHMDSPWPPYFNATYLKDPLPLLGKKAKKS